MMHCTFHHRLEPLLARIKEKRSAILCPLVDAINDKTLEHSKYKGSAVGGFSWSLHFTWDPVSPRELKRRKLPTDPIRYAKTWACCCWKLLCGFGGFVACCFFTFCCWKPQHGCNVPFRSSMFLLHCVRHVFLIGTSDLDPTCYIFMVTLRMVWFTLNIKQLVHHMVVPSGGLFNTQLSNLVFCDLKQCSEVCLLILQSVYMLWHYNSHKSAAHINRAIHKRAALVLVEFKG